jgi:hypothetical protein
MKFKNANQVEIGCNNFFFSIFHHVQLKEKLSNLETFFDTSVSLSKFVSAFSSYNLSRECYRGNLLRKEGSARVKTGLEAKGN